VRLEIMARSSMRGITISSPVVGFAPPQDGAFWPRSQSYSGRQVEAIENFRSFFNAIVKNRRHQNGSAAADGLRIVTAVCVRVGFRLSIWISPKPLSCNARSALQAFS
jgi:hypothetical protein